MMYAVCFLLISLIWGSSFIFMDRASLAFGPITIGALGTVGGGVVTGLVWMARRLACPSLRGRLLLLLLIVIPGYAWPFVLQPYLVKGIGHGYISVFISLVPLFTILVSIPYFRETPSRVQLFGVLVGLGFLVVYLWEGLDRSAPLPLLLLATTVPFGYAVSNCTIKRWFLDVPSVPLACLCMFTCAAMLTPLALTLESVNRNADMTAAVGAMSLLALLGRGLGVILLYILIFRRGPLFASMTAYMIPVVALTWGLLDGELITGRQLLAVAGVLLMVAAVQGDIERRARADEKGAN